MKANELMIGDWVQIRHGRKLKLELDQFYAQGCHEFREHPIDYFSTFDPIPLTEEILKANGFNIRRDAYYLSCGFLGNDWERSGVEVQFYDRAVIDIECNYFKHTNRIHLVADYVHELQHALRLCGRNDLADNFSLTKE